MFENPLLVPYIEKEISSMYQRVQDFTNLKDVERILIREFRKEKGKPFSRQAKRITKLAQNSKLVMDVPKGLRHRHPHHPLHPCDFRAAFDDSPKC